MFEKIFKRQMHIEEIRDIKDGIPTRMYEEALKMLQDAKKDGKKQFALAIVETDKEGRATMASFAKVMSDANFGHVMFGMMKEFMERSRDPKMDLIAHVLQAIFSGEPMDVDVEVDEPKKETVN